MTIPQKLRLIILLIIASNVLVNAQNIQTQRVWSDYPAYTQVFENQNENGVTSDICDGIWQGEQKPQLPRVKNPSSKIKSWHQGEGYNYTIEETDSITCGKYPNPVRIWEAEPYPIGNGRLAASVFHGSGRDRYALNEVSFWSGGHNSGVTNNKGDKKFNGLHGPEVAETGFGGYQPIGDLIIDFGQPVEKGTFIRELQTNNGVVSSSGKRNGVTVGSVAFSSYPDQVIVLHYKADKGSAMNGKVTFATQRETDSVSVSDNTISLYCRLGNGMESHTRVTILNSGGKLIDRKKHIQFDNLDSCTFIIASETNYEMDFHKNFRGASAEARINERMHKIDGFSYNEIYSRHIADYQSLYNRQSLSLGKSDDSLNRMPTRKRLEAYRKNSCDPELEEILFNFGRYLMIATSRPGSLPAGLQGIWNGMIKAPWGGDYHSNINFQMVYWLPEVGNISECHESMLDYLYAMREPFRRATHEYLDAVGLTKNKTTDGWMVYTSHNPFGAGGWQVNLPGSAWYGLHMWEHFAFTNDTTYLRTKAYPMMKELSEYWQAHLKPLGKGGKGFESEYQPIDVSMYPELSHIKDGTLVVPNGWSPEHGPRGEDGVAHDQQIISELFLNTIKAARILDVDKLWCGDLKNTQERLYPSQIGKMGNLMEWMIDRDPQTDHRHTSHLFSLFPGSTINIEKTPELAEAARKSLLLRKTTGDSRRSWAWTWRSVLWARLRDGNKAHEMIEGLITHNMLDNLFTTHHIPLQIDGNYGITGAMLETLVQSHSGVIELLPAPNAKWAKGSIRGAKARGNIEVDLTWEGERVTDWKLYSDSEKAVKVFVNGEYIDVVPHKRTEQSNL